MNVGVELVADPALLLLDEPTSGLDSAASKALMAALQAVARSGVTVAAVLHQPSHEIFDGYFDDLLLLGRGGRTAFYGPTCEAQAYFEGLGYVLPPRANPADALLDIVVGGLARSAGGAEQEQQQARYHAAVAFVCLAVPAADCRTYLRRAGCLPPLAVPGLGAALWAGWRFGGRRRRRAASHDAAARSARGAGRRG